MKAILGLLPAVLLVVAVFAVSPARAQEDMGRLLKQLEEDTDRFSKSLNQGLDSSQYNGTNAEDEINLYVKQFEDAADRLKKNHDKGQNNRVAAQDVLARARSINRFLSKHKLDATVFTDWRTVRNDLDRLARANKMRMSW